MAKQDHKGKFDQVRSSKQSADEYSENEFEQE